MPVFFSSEGNPEIWAERPEGYLTEEEWAAAHPDPEPEPVSTEVLFMNLRAARDAKLTATDFMMMPDYPASEEDKAAVQQYRQALRDLPSQDGAPWDGGGDTTPWPALAVKLGTDAKPATPAPASVFTYGL